tara:strand:+ start:171 stop:1019 length:849 start_codon:yes stop_codon:yes gene_type:complete
MSNEETKEAVVEETKAEETKVEETTAETTEEEMSPWYYFFSQGCGFCKKSEPIIDELNKSGKYPEILKLDMAEPDNQKLNKELQEEYKTQCGTPWFINADTGKGICGFREKDILEKWLAGEDIPVPPRPTGPPPKWPFEGASKEEEAKFKEDYNKWLKDNEHMPKDFIDKQRSADDILSGPRAKSDPPRPPMGVSLKDATDEQLEEFGKEYQKWVDDNNHLPNLQPGESIVNNLKNRRNQMKNQATGNAPAAGSSNLSPDQNARLQRLEQKVDKLIKHLGVK